MPPAAFALLEAQAGVATIDQLVRCGVARGTVYTRAQRGPWRRLLPGVVTVDRSRTRLQLVVAAWLYGGEGAAVDGADACAWHGLLPRRPIEAPVYVVVPADAAARSRGFVVVRRSSAEIPVGGRSAAAYVDRATALVVAARSARSERDAIGLLSTGLQRGAVTVNELLQARSAIGDKWCRSVDAALRAVGVGLRSPAEEDVRRLVASSRVLPEPRWNQWIDLGDSGSPVCADGLWDAAGMVNEVLGRRYHLWGEQFETTEKRRARMIAAGLVVQGCTAIQARREGAQVLERLERTYRLNRGRGLPPSVRLIAPPRIAQ